MLRRDLYKLTAVLKLCGQLCSCVCRQHDFYSFYDSLTYIESAFLLLRGTPFLCFVQASKLQGVSRKLLQKNREYLSQFFLNFYAVLNLCLKSA